MIQINLLEQASRNKKLSAVKRKMSSGGGPNLASLLILLAGVAVLAVDGVAGWLAFSAFNEARAEYVAIENEVATLQEEMDEKLSTASEIRKVRKVLNNQMEVLRSLDPTDRILWAEKMNMLARLVPEQVFLTEVEVSEEIKMRATEESRRALEAWEKTTEKERGEKPEVVKVPIIKHELQLTGLALGDDNVQQFNNMMKFHDAMMTFNTVDEKGVERRFMDGFEDEIEFNSVEAEVYHGKPVNKFSFVLKTVPQNPGDAKTQIASK